MPIEDDGSSSLTDDVNLLSDEETGLIPAEDQDQEVEVYEPEEVNEETEVIPISSRAPAVQDDIPVPASGEVLAPADRVAFAQVKKVYPDFFKKFPGLGRVIQREREYAMLFPTVDMAKDAKEQSEAMNVLQEDIINGDLTKFLAAVKDLGDPALLNLSRRFLFALSKTSMDAHWQAALPLLQNTVRAFHNDGVRQGQTDQGQNYVNSSLFLSQYLFGNFDVATGKVNAVEPLGKPAEKTDVQRDREKFEKEQYDNFWQNVANDVAEKLTAAISEKAADGTYKVDPGGTMSDWLRNSVISAIFNEVQDQMSSDAAHQGYMNSLWVAARRNKTYNRETQAKIQTAFLARAKPLIAAIRPRLSAEATGTRVRAERAESTTTRRDPRPQGRPASGGSRSASAKDIDWDSTSDLDILNGTEKTKQARRN